MGMLKDIGDAATLRSDYYRRKIPNVGPDVFYTEDQLQKVLERADQAGKEFRESLNPLKSVPLLGELLSPFTNATEDRRVAKEQLLDSNPWLWQLLEEVVDARLRMLTSDEPWAKDKKYGWKMDITQRKPPESPYFQYLKDEETGMPYVDDTEAALDLMEKMPDWYESERNKFKDYLSHPYNMSITPSTRKEGGDDSWYESTNDILDAVLATKLDEKDRQALYDAAQYIWTNRILNEKKNMPIDEGEDVEEKFRQSPYGRFVDFKGIPVRMFAPKSMLGSMLGDMIAPSWSAVAFDPELYYKTPAIEMAARGLNDAAQIALSEVLPWLGAIRGARMATRPLVGGVLGGAVGGATDYGAKRIVNEAFDKVTGHGTDNQPLNLWDLGEYGVLGALTGPLIGSGRVKGQQELRRTMNELKPESVTPDDVKASFEAARKYGENPDVANMKFKTGGKTGFDQYEKDYPDDVRTFHAFPVPKAKGLGLAMDLPMGDVRSFRIPYYTDFDERVFGKSHVYAVPGKYENKGKLVDPNKTNVAPLAKTNAKGKPLKSEIEYTTPVAWESGLNPEFVENYIKENPKYFGKMVENGKARGLSNENKLGLGAVLSEAQKKGSPLAPLFSGKDIQLSGKDMSALKATYAGNTLNDEKARGIDLVNRALGIHSDIVPTKRRDKTIFGKRIPVFGKGKVDEARQKKQFDQANKTYSRRSNQKMVSKDQYKKMTEGHYPIRRGLGLLAPILNNAVPFGSNTIMNVNPIEYEE